MAFDAARDQWTALPPLPLESRECFPRSVSLGDLLFAWYCGQAVLLHPGDRWEPLPVPDDANGRVVAIDGVALIAGPDGLWLFDPHAR